jgi:hypothetical protein
MGTQPTPDAEPSSNDSTWCLVGNIVAEHEYGEPKEILHGSKHFTAGTKVYCLPAQWGDGFESAIVVGICRKSRRWITVVIPTKLITNWRAKVVYSPTVLSRLRNGFDGFSHQWSSREDVEHWADMLRQRDGLA